MNYEFQFLSEVEETKEYKKYFAELNNVIKPLFTGQNDVAHQNIFQYYNLYQNSDIDSFIWLIQLMVHFYYLRPKERQFLYNLVCELCEKFSNYPSNFIYYMNQTKYQIPFESYFCILSLTVPSILKEYGKEPKYKIKFNIEVYDPSSIQYWIKEDDIDSLQSYIAKNTSENVSAMVFDIMHTPVECIENVDKTSIINFSAFYGSINIFKYLIMNNSKISENICMYAIAGRNFEIIHILEQKNFKFRNCLKMSVKYHCYDLTDWLLMNFECEPIFLQETVQLYNYEAFLFFLNNNYLVNEFEHNMKNVLQTASWNGHLEVLKFLYENILSNLSNFDDDCQENVYTPLHYACWNGHLSLVEYLVNEIKFDVNLPGQDLITPIHIAARDGYLSIVQFLASKGCNLEPKTANGQTPLHLASYFGRRNVVEFLVSKGVDKNPSDNDGKTPSDISCEFVFADFSENEAIINLLR